MAQADVQHECQESQHERHEHRHVARDLPGDVVHDERQAAELDPGLGEPRGGSQILLRGLCNPSRLDVQGTTRVVGLRPEAHLNGGQRPIVAHQVAHDAVVRPNARTEIDHHLVGGAQAVRVHQPSHVDAPLRALELEGVGEAGDVGDLVHRLVQLGERGDEEEDIAAVDAVHLHQHHAVLVAAEDLGYPPILLHQRIGSAEIAHEVHVQAQPRRPPTARQDRQSGDPEDGLPSPNHPTAEASPRPGPALHRATTTASHRSLPRSPSQPG